MHHPKPDTDRKPLMDALAHIIAHRKSQRLIARQLADAIRDGDHARVTALRDQLTERRLLHLRRRDERRRLLG